MEEQAKQVFYMQDPCDERWSVVLHGKTIGVNVEDDDSYMDTITMKENIIVMLGYLLHMRRIPYLVNILRFQV